MRNFGQAVAKAIRDDVLMMFALLTWRWAYGIYKSIGRVRTQSDADDFLTPLNTDRYPVFLWSAFFCWRSLPSGAAKSLILGATLGEDELIVNLPTFV